jgi:geranylgeranyl pyrophosphate synthase
MIQGAGVSQHAAHGSLLLEPVRPGLERVETRLRNVDGSLFAPLSNAFVGLIGSGGKRLRPALALLAAELNGPITDPLIQERTIALASAVEMLHTSTLVHDDVIDGALLRRGAPTLNALWSGGSTVLAGNYMFGGAAQLAAETGNMRVVHLFANTLQVIVAGELRQLQDRYDYAQPKESYYGRIYAKTASLLCAATEGAAILASMTEPQIIALHDYGYHLGMAFQIVDDILDFTGSEGSLGKPAGSDLVQGTLTLPFFYYLRTLRDPQRLIDRLEFAHGEAALENPRIWRDTLSEVVAELRTSRAIEDARLEAQHFADQAHADLASFPDSAHKRALLGLTDFVLRRTF